MLKLKIKFEKNVNYSGNDILNQLVHSALFFYSLIMPAASNFSEKGRFYLKTSIFAE
jgi:hypothetical protein